MASQCKRSSFIQSSKYQLRQQFREIRKHIAASYRQEAAMKAAKHFSQHTLFQRSQHVACYLPSKDEFDSLPLIESIWNAKKHCYLPSLSKAKEKFLHFVRYCYGDALHQNEYAILEPIGTAEPIALEALDLVIIPLIAFDAAGHRLGTGGGYYDRTFAYLNEKRIRKPVLIGLAYQTQQADSLPADPWDVGLQGVITEAGYRKI